MGLAGTPEQAGTEPVHTTAAAVFALSANLTSPPVAIAILLAGFGLLPEPAIAQHGQLLSTQFSLTSSFVSDGTAATAGSTASTAPNSATQANIKNVTGLIEPTFLVLDVPKWQLQDTAQRAGSRLLIA
jgi:hypothetical protein